MSHRAKWRMFKGGASVYVVRKTSAGWVQDRTIAKGLTKAEARASVKRLNREFKGRSHERAGLAPSTLTVEDACSLYLDDLLERIEDGNAAKSSHDSYSRYARLHVVPEIGTIELEALDVADVQFVVDVMTRKGLKPQTQRHAVAVLRASVNFARRRKLFRGENAAESKDLVIASVKTTIKELLEPEEMRPVIEHSLEHLRPFFATLLLTGMRPIEALRIEPANINLRSRPPTITLVRTKTGTPRVVPFNAALRPFLKEALKHARPDCLFPCDRGELQHQQKRTARLLHAAMVRAAEAGYESLVVGWTLKCRRKGCGHHEPSAHRVDDLECPTCGFTLWSSGKARAVRPYDLRGTFATNMVSQGVPIAHVARIMGTSVKMLEQHYLGLRQSELADISAKIGLPDAEPNKVLPMKRRK